MKTQTKYFDSSNEDLLYSEEYAKFIMENSKGDIAVCDGDSLLEYMESGYMFDEFLKTI